MTTQLSPGVIGVDVGGTNTDVCRHKNNFNLLTGTHTTAGSPPSRTRCFSLAQGPDDSQYPDRSPAVDPASHPERRHISCRYIFCAYWDYSNLESILTHLEHVLRELMGVFSNLSMLSLRRMAISLTKSPSSDSADRTHRARHLLVRLHHTLVPCTPKSITGWTLNDSFLQLGSRLVCENWWKAIMPFCMVDTKVRYPMILSCIALQELP